MSHKNQANVLAKECMVTALMKLVQTKPLSSISISEITEYAGVSRMTYYRNYSSKEEIFKIYMDEIIQSFKQDVSVWVDKGFYNNYQNIVHCFEYFSRYKDFINCLISVGMGDMMLSALSHYVLDAYFKESSDMKFYYTLQAYAGSLYNTYISWITNQAKESGEDMAQMIYDIYKQK